LLEHGKDLQALAAAAAISCCCSRPAVSCSTFLACAVQLCQSWQQLSLTRQQRRTEGLGLLIFKALKIVPGGQLNCCAPCIAKFASPQVAKVGITGEAGGMGTGGLGTAGGGLGTAGGGLG
jgi:hypothetical protein